MGKKVTLSEKEIELIEAHRGEELANKRPRLSDEEIEVIQDYRRVRNEANEMGVDPKSVRGGWLKSKHVSLQFRNFAYNAGTTPENVRDAFIEDAKKYAPVYPIIERPNRLKKYLLTLNIADLHIGKLSVETGTGEAYNTDKAIHIALKAVNSILQDASGYPIDKIVLPIGNDILHTDGHRASTTKGTPQDTSGTWHDNFIAARKMYVKVIELLIQVADVHVIHVPSNHDYANGFMLADSVSSWFHNSKNVTFDVDMTHRKYYRYGQNLLGYSHGDGAKMEHLPLIMANESKNDWSSTAFRYFYLNHIHHKDYFKFRSGKDYHGVTVEYMRSPSGTDQWHHENGYQHNKKAIEAFIHHKDNGQVARITCHN